MTDIERHIVELLLDNDCVIVPGFGGFMTHNLAASYDKANNVFLPPSRTIGFNPRLTMNDSLLAQSYVNCYDISYPEALRRIERDVDNLKQLVEKDGGHTICGIGKIMVLADGRYDFIPEESGIMAPGLYGFEPFEIEMREQNAEEATKCTGYGEPDDEEDYTPALSNCEFPNNTPIITPAKENLQVQVAGKPVSKEIAVRIPLKVMKHIAAACVIMFVLLSFPAKLGDASTSALKRSSIGTNLIYEIMPKEMTSGKPKSLRDIHSVTTKTDRKTEKSVKKESSTSYSSGQNNYFSIVLASRITLKNAQAYVEKLHKKGMVEAKVYTVNGMTKVVYNHYNTRAEANNAMNILIKNNEFAGCWIINIK